MRRSHRRFVIFTGVLCLAVGIGLAVFWEEAAIRYHLHRFRTEPDYLLAVVVDPVGREDAWHPRHSLAWAAVGELMKSEEGRKAFIRALQSVEFEESIVAGVEDLRRRVLQENRSPLQ